MGFQCNIGTWGALPYEKGMYARIKGKEPYPLRERFMVKPYPLQEQFLHESCPLWEQFFFEITRGGGIFEKLPFVEGLS